MWFEEIAKAENPGKKELKMFVQDVRGFLGSVLENSQDFGFLWAENPELHDLALDTYKHDILNGAGLRLDSAIPKIGPRSLNDHGLEGRPLKFKFGVLASISNQWTQARASFSIRDWFKKIVDAIDAILDSLIDAAGGAGGLIKEFKDALSSLA